MKINRAKIEYEKALYTDEPVNESVLRKDKKFYDLYKSIKCKSPDRIFEESVNELADISSDEIKKKKTKHAVRRGLNVGSGNIYNNLINHLEDVFDFHPSYMTRERYEMLDKRFVQIREVISNFISTINTPHAKSVKKELLDLKTTSDILDYLYLRIM